MSTKNKITVKQKREDAKMRQAHWNALTPAQRLASLNTRPGASKKERARLNIALENLKEAIKKA